MVCHKQFSSFLYVWLNKVQFGRTNLLYISNAESLTIYEILIAVSIINYALVTNLGYGLIHT